MTVPFAPQTTTRSVTAATTVAANEIVLADATAAAYTVTGPAAGTSRRWGVKKTDTGTNVVTISYVNSAGSVATVTLTVGSDGKTFDPAGSGYEATGADRSRTQDDARYLPGKRRFAVFGDSWTTTVNGANVPSLAIPAAGGTIVKNHGVSGAQIGSSTDAATTTGQQVAAATADASYDKTSITDVLVIAGVNNIGGVDLTPTAAATQFSAIGALYPNARRWYAANSKKAINNAGDTDPWHFYSRIFEGASMAGFAVATWSPQWTWGEERDSGVWWLAGSVDSDRHPSQAGFTVYASRLAGFLSGQGWRPHFAVPLAIHADLTALAAGAALNIDNSYVDGDILRIRAAITGLDSVTTASGMVNALTWSTAYAPRGDYMLFPVVKRTGSNLYTLTNAGQATEGTGIITLQAAAINGDVGYLVVNADLPLRTRKS